MEKLKNKKVGRPKYQPNIEQLKQLFEKVANKTITNEERMANCKMSVRPNGLN
jgi:hypothetical protein